MKIRACLIVLWMCFVSHGLWGHVAEYSVKALGIKVADLIIENNTSSKNIKVSVQSTITNRMFPHIDNKYQVNYTKGYYPVSYLRKIHQKDYRDTVSVVYDHEYHSAQMNRSSSAVVDKYKFTNNSRDYFSFFSMLTIEDCPSGKYVIDGNGCPWVANVSYEKSEAINTEIGKFNAKKYNVSFQNMVGTKMPYIDMVTHNLLTEDTKLSLWISDNHIAIKATMRKKAVSMIWDIIGYHN